MLFEVRFVPIFAICNQKQETWICTLSVSPTGKMAVGSQDLRLLGHALRDELEDIGGRGVCWHTKG